MFQNVCKSIEFVYLIYTWVRTQFEGLGGAHNIIFEPQAFHIFTTAFFHTVMQCFLHDSIYELSPGPSHPAIDKHSKSPTTTSITISHITIHSKRAV